MASLLLIPLTIKQLSTQWMFRIAILLRLIENINTS